MLRSGLNFLDKQTNKMNRVVSQHRTALARQVSEAVRIGRRGGAGAVLNSKAEYNRCHIPRLRMRRSLNSGSNRYRRRIDWLRIL